MAVYKRGYRPYRGSLTPEWSRFLILPRFTLENIFDSKFLVGFYCLCFLPFLVAGTFIYISNNDVVKALLGFRGNVQVLTIDGQFFAVFMRFQAGLAFLLTAWVGPGLVAPDLSNNALPLYLARPFSRVEYVLGKISVLVLLLGGITWAPDLLLYLMQSSLAGGTWWSANLHIARAIVLGFGVWIAILSLLSMALSAWVKWRIAATGLMFAIFFVGAGFGEAVNGIMRTYWGKSLNLVYLMYVIWNGLLDIPLDRNFGRRSIGEARLHDVPLGWAWVILIGVCVICLLMLNRKLRAKEVVRG